MLQTATSSLSFIKNNRLAFLTTCTSCGHRSHESWLCEDCSCYFNSRDSSHKKSLQKTHLWLNSIHKTMPIKKLMGGANISILWLERDDVVYQPAYSTMLWCSQCKKRRRHAQLLPLYTRNAVTICLACDGTQEYTIIPPPIAFINQAAGRQVANLMGIIPAPLTEKIKPRRKRK